MVLLELIYFLLCWIIIYALISISPAKKCVRIKLPFFIVLHTKRFNESLKRLSTRLRKLIILFGNVSIPLAFIVMAYVFFLLIDNFLRLFFVPEVAAPVIPLLPFITITLESIPYFLLAVSLVIVFHEGMHALMLHAENIKVKSMGVFLFLLFMGAFVEEDKEELKKSKLPTKLRVYSSGCTTNLLLALFFLLLVIFAFTPAGTIIAEVLEDSPAFSNLQPNDIIIGINGTPIKTFDDLSVYMSRVKPGQIVNITSQREGRILTTLIKTGHHPENESLAFLGVRIKYFSNYKCVLPIPVPHHIVFLAVFWSFFISFFAGIFNLFPAPPLDGYYFLTSLIEKFRGAKSIKTVISVLAWSLILANIFLTFIRFGLMKI